MPPNQTRAANLPTPDPQALAASAKLLEQICASIATNGGWMPFSAYMAAALYTPGLGYYAGGAARFGSAGDFVTAPEVSSLFGRALARQVADVLQQTRPQILEFGAGSGKLAADLLSALANLGVNVERYAILEVSGALRAQQEATLHERVPALAGKVVWLDAWPDAIEGCVIANEVLDAMPADRVTWQSGELLVWGVCRADTGEGLVLAARPATGALREAMQEVASEHILPDGYTSEISLAARAWSADLAKRLTHGLALMVDYGFPASEYYHPQRDQGTLRGHYRHHAIDDPLFLPGLADLTVHVDFTAIALAAQEAGATVAGYASQAQFLINCGIGDLLAASDVADTRRHAAMAREANILMSPAEMGELFKVLAFTRGLAHDGRGFSSGNRIQTL